MLTYFQPLAAVAMFSVAQPMARLFSVFAGSISRILFPISSEMYSNNLIEELSNTLGRIQKLLPVLLTPIGAFLIVFADIFLNGLFGTQYVRATMTAQFLIVAAIINSVSLVNVPS